MAKKENPYFDDFVAMVELSCQAADHLQSSLKNFRPESLPELRKTMHDIEHAEDKLKHGIMRRLVKEFISPIDREDIMQLAQELDDVTDKIEDILIRIDMYNIKSIQSPACDLADVIVRCCQTLQRALIEFPNYQKSQILKQLIIDVNSMEEEGDAIYVNAMRELYRSNTDPVLISSWSEIYERLEDCCDACEHVSDVMEIVVMKNS